MSDCKHKIDIDSNGDWACSICCMKYDDVQMEKITEARADALRMAKIALAYIKKEIGTIKIYESGNGAYAAGLDGISVSEIIAKYEEKP